MYTGLLHSHRLVVILFLLLYVVKLALLIFGKAGQLDTFSRRTRIPEMVLSALFLLTGIGLLTMVAQITTMVLIKLAMVFASIPVAIIGFRRKNVWLGALSVLLIVGAYGMAEANKVGVDATPLAAGLITDPLNDGYDKLAHGGAIYTRNCVVCHGADGQAGKSGAKNLATTQLADADIEALLLAGKNSMPAYGKLLGEADRAAVIAYLRTFKRP
ncbi:MAG: hypothetical protein OHK0039_31940 [Bacteroidia bacterium]